MIEAKGLARRYGSFTAVSDVSFRVEEGQTLILIGPSGCGKTTTLKMANRLITPSAGEVFVEGRNVRELPETVLRRRMGYVIQSIGLFPHYTVSQNIAVVPRLLNWPRARIRERVGALLEQLGLPPGQYADKYPHQLSGGQQQRVGIARALAAEPPIVLMDEPFGALDPLARQQIRRDFREIEELRSKTVIMVTHDIEEAFEMGSLICLLDKGAVQQLGRPEELLLSPANDFVQAFLAEKAAQLEFRAHSLADVFAQLEQGDGPQGPALEMPPDTPVLQALYLLARQGGQGAYGRTLHYGQWRWFTLEGLFGLFRQMLKRWND
ncbi:MAG: ABC transporter ATP-binding protein [Phaeodactylibacter sp.]|nr:ABC transporter ATP-binding protein [Phaeodactylibacter sp.]MCB9276076.1 ABC transporter ATP-binding protein [Lewinellaceae bacterium]